MKAILKTLLREALISSSEQDLTKVADFVNFAKEFLDITDDIKVQLAFERTDELRTTANYNLSGSVTVYAKDRALVDICRSIAHELVHHKQNLEDRIKNAQEDGEDGSEIENEANAIAGVIIRKYGKLKPEIYL